MRYSYISLLAATLACTLPLALSTSALAATQGTLGTSSTGVANITVTKAAQAQITDVADMTFSNWTTSSGAITLYSNLCVYSTTGSYTVTATGNGTANAFTINNGLNTVAYSVTWNAGGAANLANTGTALTTNSTSSNFGNAATLSATCGTALTDTARVVVGITSSAMTSVPSGTYSGTLTMLIAPY